MRYTSKIPIFILSLVVAIALIFCVGALAAADTESMSIVGAQRTHRDFTSDSFEFHVNEDGGVPAVPQTKVGETDLFEAVSFKYGHLRTVKVPSGNTVLDLTFEADYTGKVGGMNDVLMSAVPSTLPVGDLVYFVIEFDMTTRTSYPGDICLLMETRIFNEALTKEVSSSYRTRPPMGSYSAAEGKWIFGENTRALETNAWVHITLVTKMSPVYTTTDDGITVNYGTSKANVYVNGQYVSSVNPFADAELDPTSVPVIHYAGIGYEFGKAHTGQKAGDSVSIDNCTYTTFDTSYAQTSETDRLAKLFALEPLSDITNLGEEILYTSDYAFPAPVGLATYRIGDGEELLVANFEDALAHIRASGSKEGVIKLYANQYHKVEIDFPVTVELNGYALQNGFEAASSLAVVYDTEKDILSAYKDPTRLATFYYYDLPYGTEGAAPVLTEQYALGREFALAPFDQINPVITVSANEGFAPVGEFVMYDGGGTQVEIEGITEENLGKSYHIYPVYDRTVLEGSITFYTVMDGKVRFYDSGDLWAAANVQTEQILCEDDEKKVTLTYPKAMPDGAKIVLVADAFISEPLYTRGGALTVDLAGHTVTSDGAFVTSGAQSTETTVIKSSGATSRAFTYFIHDMQIFVYSSRAGGAIDVKKSDLISANFNIGVLNGVDYFFGYQSENKVSPERIRITLGAKLAYVQKGSLNTVHFANADICSTTTDGKGWITSAQSRGHQFYFEDCSLFLKNHLVASDANTATKQVYFKNSSIYGSGENNISYLVDYKAYTPETAYAGTTDGTMTVSLENSKIYNMNFGDVRVEGYHKPNATATPTHRVTQTNLIMDLTSMISCEPIGVTNTIEGKKLLAAPESVTVDDVLYATTYAWVDEDTRYATFHIYNVSFDQLDEGQIPEQTQRVAIGYWFKTGVVPNGETFYDPTGDATSLLAPRGYAVYDADGKVIDERVLTDADADAVFTVCVYYEKMPIAFRIKYADGTYRAFTTSNISGALGTGVIGTATYCVLPEGATVMLFADCTTSETLLANNSYIDLNGYTLYAERKRATFSAAAEKALFVYSSREGARICQTPTVDAGSGYVYEGKHRLSRAYIGYRNADSTSEHAIEIFCGAFAELQGAGAEVYLAKITLCANGRDNYGLFNIRAGTDTTRAFFIEGCEIYSNRGGFFTVREGSGSGTLTMKNSNLYATSSAGLFNWYSRREQEITAAIYLENSGIWGAVTLGGLENGLGVATVYVSGDCVLPATNKHVVLTDVGRALIPTTSTVTLDGIMAPEGGIYGAEQKRLFAGTFSAAYGVGASENFKASTYVNVTLDTNLVLNFYVPAINEVSGVFLGEHSILDTQRTETINGSKFYVISLEAAPKQGDKVFSVSVRMKDGTSHEFTLSLARYAEKLFGLEAAQGSYAADAQQLMRYILTYIKEVALEYGGAEQSLFSELGDFGVDTEIDITEPVHKLDAIHDYVTHAALDLDAYAGFAFKVEKDFVGTVKLELAGLAAVEYTYTAQSPAPEGEVIVLENVPVHLLRGDVQITVTPANEASVSASFNLSTYFSANNKPWVKALYAYAIAARSFNTKHPTVGALS